MSTINKYEGDDILLVEELNLSARQSIKNIIDKEEWTSYRVFVKGFETNVGNFFGSLQKVTVNGKTKDDREKELILFLKNIVCAPEEFSVINVPNIFQREGFFYKELFNIFEKIQDKYNIAHGERFKTVKEFSELNNEIIILEDVSHVGYKTYDRMDVIPLKFAELAIEQLAKLNAMSFIIQKDNPIFFENNIKTLKSVFNLDAYFEDYLRKTFDIAKESLKENLKCKLENNYPKLVKNYLNNLKISVDESVCIVHGDFWPSNVLVKEIGNEPTDVILIDYQFASFAHPVTDILKFIF
ncbi:uncharacterized protein LOC114363689 isoform X1 [Ostrinia furnacalis]|uniref:uncharacterized protein LOC114363689 isoform X1 n=1 Tax=Ostrinia furnacalis TaxID=93504 RepID=UPI00103DE197|nr:uncharacterized protein LOC114363689 isoform X1 [Ostrinia furnacalis]